jgi:hypothetical protein
MQVPSRYGPAFETAHMVFSALADEVAPLLVGQRRRPIGRERPLEMLGGGEVSAGRAQVLGGGDPPEKILEGCAGALVLCTQRHVATLFHGEHTGLPQRHYIEGLHQEIQRPLKHERCMGIE